MEKERFYRSQQSTTRGFMGMALQALSVLTRLAANPAILARSCALAIQHTYCVDSHILSRCAYAPSCFGLSALCTDAVGIEHCLNTHLHKYRGSWEHPLGSNSWRTMLGACMRQGNACTAGSLPKAATGRARGIRDAGIPQCARRAALCQPAGMPASFSLTLFT